MIMIHLTSNRLKLPYWNAVPVLKMAHPEPDQEFLHVICTFEWMPWTNLSSLWEISDQHHSYSIFPSSCVSYSISYNIWKSLQVMKMYFGTNFWSNFTGVFLNVSKDLHSLPMGNLSFTSIFYLSRLSKNESHWKLLGDNGTYLYSFRALKRN